MIVLIIGAALFLIGLILCIVAYLWNKPASAINVRALYDDQKKQLGAQLIEKKNAKEKELTDELNQKIEEIQRQKDKIQADCDLEAQRYNDYVKTIAQSREEIQQEFEDLKSKRKEKIERYEAEDQQFAADRIRRNQEEVAAEQHKQEEILAKLNSDFEKQKEELKLDFFSYSEQINLKKENLEKEIQAYEKQQEQIIARFREDERIRNERDFYKIKIDQAAAQDIQKLKALALSFNNPNAIYKLIWEVYYKTPMEALFKKVLGDNGDKGGIYKITDITNEKVYVGRTTNFLTRLRQHSKRGCGIDTIKGLLYEALMEKGLENFTFEIIEVCPKDQQPEREKYWIKFYNSNVYGYNILSGG